MRHISRRPCPDCQAIRRHTSWRLTPASQIKFTAQLCWRLSALEARVTLSGFVGHIEVYRNNRRIGLECIHKVKTAVLETFIGLSIECRLIGLDRLDIIRSKLSWLFNQVVCTSLLRCSSYGSHTDKFYAEKSGMIVDHGAQLLKTCTKVS